MRIMCQGADEADDEAWEDSGLYAQGDASPAGHQGNGGTPPGEPSKKFGARPSD